MGKDNVLPRFVVRFSRTHYFVNRDLNGDAQTTLIPSFATALQYPTACEVAQALRNSGYADARVCDFYGRAVSGEDAAEIEDFSNRDFESVWAKESEV